jgi:hypothetical protein
VPGTAIVWAVPTTAYSDGGAVPVNLFVQQAGVCSVNSDTGGAMVTPLVANGRVYLATDGMVSVYGVQ